MTEENLVQANDGGQDDSEAEEALSLRDLPIQRNSTNDKENILQSSSDDQGIFEFYTSITKTEHMRPADDIIFGGKLLPYKSPNSFTPTSNKTSRFDERQRRNILHRKSESLNSLQRSQSSAKERLARSSHSLNYRKLHRDSSTPKISRSTSRNDGVSAVTTSCFGKTDSSKPKWRVLAFGFMGTPTEMELKDIRNRQSRRSPATLFPSFDGEERDSGRKDEEKGSWKLLRVLSCKGEANGVITEALTCIRQV
ncbi:hypothetical protein ACHQM5_030156 [Ranunculus cassubicifolius]